jgi:hypothetical protein
MYKFSLGKLRAVNFYAHWIEGGKKKTRKVETLKEGFTVAGTKRLSWVTKENVYQMGTNIIEVRQ